MPFIGWEFLMGSSTSRYITMLHGDPSTLCGFRTTGVVFDNVGESISTVYLPSQ